MERDNFSNLDKEFKWLGIIEYKTLTILLILVAIIWNVSGLFVRNTIYRIYAEVIIIIPVFGLFYSNKYSENITEIVFAILKYVVSPKLYVYKIESNINTLK